MDVAVTAAIIAALVSIISWIANYIFSGLAERRHQKLSASLKHIEKQLEELYGPLAFLIIEGKRSFYDLLEALGRNCVFSIEKDLSPEELKTWLFWAENDILPRNEKIQVLLSSKTHLIEGGKMPKSYLNFLDHYNSWKLSHLRWKKEGKKYSWHSKINWPEDFDNNVLNTFENLKQRHSCLVGKV